MDRKRKARWVLEGVLDRAAGCAAGLIGFYLWRGQAHRPVFHAEQQARQPAGWPEPGDPAAQWQYLLGRRSRGQVAALRRQHPHRDRQSASGHGHGRSSGTSGKARCQDLQQMTARTVPPPVRLAVPAAAGQGQWQWPGPEPGPGQWRGRAAGRPGGWRRQRVHRA